MAELLVGLVCIMLLVAGLQQVSILSQKGFLAMNNARHAMALQYAEDPPTQWPRFNFSNPTQPGSDGEHLTADDRKSGGDDTFYQDNNGYLDMVFDDNLEGHLLEAGRISPHVDLKYSGGVFSTTTALDMMHTAGHESADTVLFMDKVLGRDHILLNHDLWMPRWDAIP